MRQPLSQNRSGAPRWHWRECQVERLERYPGQEPPEPQIGQGWYDASHGSLYIWDGREWVCVPAD